MGVVPFDNVLFLGWMEESWAKEDGIHSPTHRHAPVSSSSSPSLFINIVLIVSYSTTLLFGLIYCVSIKLGL